MSCDVEVTNERVHCWKKRSYVTKQFFYGVITTDKLDTYKASKADFRALILVKGNFHLIFIK